MNIAQQTPPPAAVRFLKGPLSGITFDLVQSITTIGRDKSNDLIVAVQKVSRFHARLIYNDGEWRIEKLSQTSSVTVDQQSIETFPLSHNVVVELGEDTTFLFLVDKSQGEVAEQLPPISASLPSGASPVLAVEPVLSVNQEDGDQLSAVAQAQPPLDASQEQTARPAGTEFASLTALGIPSIEIRDNAGKIIQRYPLAQKVISVGRVAENDVVIPDQCVSAFHVQIVREGERYVLIHPHPERQRTANGLLYQGRSIQGNESFRKPLERGDVFRIADVNGSLVTLIYNDGSGSRQEVTPLVQPIGLGAAEISLGRLQDNDVVLNHPQVSAHHARLIREQGSYRLVDLNSTNHIYVNGLHVTSQLLQPRDEVRIGPFRFTYADTELIQYDESKGVRIDALDLKKVGNNQTILLNDISLSIPARSFVVLVGGSGAGKTTLLDALSGLRPAQDGSVYYNGQDYYHHMAAFSTQLGYVPQDDIIHRELTVERALYYAAKLRLPRDFTEAQIWQRIEEVLDDVEIKHRRSLLISRLSGGQRKRVSIALELLAKPSVFFLDEPTSGLDPGLDRKMMLLLRKLADKG
ncbi:MAG TPA: FHA domain-containing protein, partial [Ktedonobacteraceae bacterium]